jgi:hypothetical protein
MLLGVGSAPSEGGETILIDDAFVDTPVTALSAHNISPVNTPGNSWQAIVAVGGYIWTTGTDAYFFNGYGEVVNTGVSDCTIVVKMTIGASGTVIAGAIFRATDSSNNWFVWIRTDNTSFEVWKEVAGSSTRVIQKTYAVVYNSITTITITLSGSNITVTMNDGTTSGIITDSFNSTATLHGMNDYVGTTNGSPVLFSRFTVETP